MIGRLKHLRSESQTSVLLLPLLLFLLLIILLPPPSVMTPWCKKQIPVEGNFGQLFDQLNLSINLLSREFSTSLTVQVTALLLLLQHDTSHWPVTE